MWASGADSLGLSRSSIIVCDLGKAPDPAEPPFLHLRRGDHGAHLQGRCAHCWLGHRRTWERSEGRGRWQGPPCGSTCVRGVSWVKLGAGQRAD